MIVLEICKDHGVSIRRIGHAFDVPVSTVGRWVDPACKSRRVGLCGPNGVGVERFG